jgi:glycosyltransferase 2 family protein
VDNGESSNQAVKKLFITLLKIALSVAIIAYLVWKSTRGAASANALVELRDQPKHWSMLAAAWACAAVAVGITFVRWWYLVIALGVPFRLRDAMRISFWGFLVNFLPFGIVGGDVLKALMLGHEHPQHRAKALASVLFDRVVGLYLLFVVASASILLTGFWRIEDAMIRLICNATFVATIVGTIGLVWVLGPDLSRGGVNRAIGRIPRIGPPLERVIDAVRMYASKPIVVLLSSLMSIGVHSLFACSCYLLARGLPGNTFSLSMYFVVMPLSSAAGVLPLPMGPLEWTLDTLYRLVPSDLPIAAGQGLVVALAYRIVTLLIAVLGLPYYFGNRREMAEVIHEVEADQPDLGLVDGRPPV